jgi:hypothetical protein
MTAYMMLSNVPRGGGGAAAGSMMIKQLPEIRYHVDNWPRQLPPPHGKPQTTWEASIARKAHS